MQVFDDASRGPWGGLVFLRKAKVTVGIVGTIITMLALAFEPFAQQIMEFPSREAPLSGIGGKIASANSWSDTALAQNEDYSASMRLWDTKGHEWGFMSVGVSILKSGYQTLDFNVTAVSQFSRPRNSTITIRAIDAAVGKSLYGKNFPLMQRAGDAVDRITKGGSQIFQLCTRQRNTSQMEPTDTERYTCISMRPNYTGLKDQNEVVTKMPISANMTWCRIHFNARRYEEVSIKDNEVKIGQTSDIPLKWLRIEGGDNIYGTDSFPETFSVGSKSREVFSFVLRNNTTEAYVDSILPAVESQGWEKFFDSVGDTYSNLMRTDSNAALAKINGTT
ncbi:hypothetical protein BDV96DRAFT_598102 [Lophiotrema nucula]|uniref:Uncharacterized protein n=1 Tax=Lophiotrema nucula TaxID=690887 RepID=A0A6A5ZCF7_9PLEO|nr:hypothetical protein BDV96DRAFT_598102 [Lophiotrema nucula]